MSQAREAARQREMNTDTAEKSIARMIDSRIRGCRAASSLGSLSKMLGIIIIVVVVVVAAAAAAIVIIINRCTGVSWFTCPTINTEFASVSRVVDLAKPPDKRV